MSDGLSDNGNISIPNIETEVIIFGNTEVYSDREWEGGTESNVVGKSKGLKNGISIGISDGDIDLIYFRVFESVMRFNTVRPLLRRSNFDSKIILFGISEGDLDSVLDGMIHSMSLSDSEEFYNGL